ncbi:MAG: TolC family protein [Alphaproteobacteria bacterium]|nr:TolC family protein [Alphaproteobacteria bacterium]
MATRRMALKATVAGAALAAVMALAPMAGAQTIDEALANAYRSNPELLAQRAALRATDETVPQALSQWRPSVTLSGNTGKARDFNSTTTTVYGANGSRDQQTTENERDRTPLQATLTVTQPLYRGGRSTAELARAEANVQAGRAQARAACTPRDPRMPSPLFNPPPRLCGPGAHINNVPAFLARQLDAARDRFQVGEITRTDVSQAEARLSQSQASRTKSEGDVNTARATFLRTTGMEAGRVSVPPVPRGLPGSAEEARAWAQAQNPNIIQARYAHESAGQDVALVEGEQLPSIALQADAIRGKETQTRGTIRDTVDVLLTFSVPIYQQGATDARVRGAKQTQGQRRTQVDVALRQAINDATTAWQQLSTARAQIGSFTAQIRANEIALEGVEQEARVGSRTVLDVLNAEQELLNSRVSLVQAQRDEVLASFQLLSAVGKLQARELGLPVEIYDPASNLSATRDRWSGNDIPGEAAKK